LIDVVSVRTFTNLTRRVVDLVLNCHHIHHQYFI